MEKATKTITTELFEIIKKTHNPYTNITWNGISIDIKHTLSLQETMTFVDSVAKLCFASDTGTYMPEVKDFGIKAYILEMYAGIEITNSTEEMHAIIYRSNLVEEVMKYINMTQLSEIANAIDVKTAHLAQANIEAINKQMNELYEAFNNLEKQIADAFSGITGESLSKFVDALADGNVNEEKLLKAYMDSQDKSSKVVPMRPGK